MKRTWALLALLVVGLVSRPCGAAMRSISAEELTAAADLVVEGTVELVASRWSQGGEAIVSSATIAVSETVRGKVAKRYVTVEYAGGEIGEIGMKVSDIEPFRKGEGVLLFLRVLRSSNEGEVHQLVGRAQGKYVIGADNIARRSGFSVVNGNGNVDNGIDVRELKQKVRNVR